MDYKYNELTPVESHDGVLFKRDDLYKPFSDFEITGGKVRQCLRLVENSIVSIKSDFNGTIATAASVHSPQAVIVARVAREFGLRCIIGHGAKKPLEHRAMQMCEAEGAELVTLVTSNAYNNVLYSHLEKLRQKRNFFTINFGYQALTNPEVIIDMNANQVQNLPDDLDLLVINVGSGVSGAGILAGIERHKPYLLNREAVWCVQPFGYDRRDVLAQSLEFGRRIHYKTGNYSYHTPLTLHVGNVKLDQIYESKGFDYMIRNIVNFEDFQRMKVCYWLIGNSNALRS
jgi:1-aminocyclopropane-1-carboxylate deaminase/D-cysteine desulfhydrase-like pyridoxal-dependent ACC family enzyme